MKKVFFDTNILVNWLISTNSCHEDSATLIKQCLQGKIKGYVSSHSLTDVFYITRKHFSVDDRKSFLSLIIDRFNIIPEYANMFSAVIHDPNNKDLEDGLQIQCAEKEHVDYLVTENLKDFFGSRVKVLSAQSAVSELR